MNKIITFLLIVLSLVFSQNTIEKIEFNSKERFIYPSSFWSGVDVVDELQIIRISGKGIVSNSEMELSTGIFDSTWSNYAIATNMRFQLLRFDIHKDTWTGSDLTARFDIQADGDVKKSVSLGVNDGYASLEYPIIPEITAPATSAKSFVYSNETECFRTTTVHGLTTNDVIWLTAQGTSYVGNFSLNTPYWVATVSNTYEFTVAASQGGSVITFTSNGSATGQAYNDITLLNVRAEVPDAGVDGTNATLSFDAWGLVYVPEN